MALKHSLRKLGWVGAALGGSVTAYILLEKKTAHLSWTTNYEPSTSWDWNWDRREPSSLCKPERRNWGSSNQITMNNDVNNNQVEDSEKVVKSSATRHLIFIRHGQYNMDGSKDEERALTTLGSEQAALTGERLAALSLPYTRLVYSSMTRATQTAKIILDKTGVEEVEVCDMLREGAPIPPEPPIGSWKAENYKFFTDGARIEAAFRKYFHRAQVSQTKDSYEIYVCHANVIRYFVCRSLQLPPEAWLRFSLHNGSMTHITIRPDGRVGIKAVGDAGFMPPNRLSFN